MSDFEISGTEQLIRVLNFLGSEPIAEIVRRKSMQAGGKVMVKAIRNETPVGKTGNLKKAIGNKTKTYHNTGATAVIIGARRGGKEKIDGVLTGNEKYKGRHLSLVENGHIAVNGKFVPGNPFLKRAFDNNIEAAKAAINAKGKQILDAEYEKLK